MSSDKPKDSDFSVESFRSRLSAVRARAVHPVRGWYPYDTLGALNTIDQRVLAIDKLLELVNNEPVLDVGCGDGDISFFLESRGCTVHAIDYSPTNFNGMLGVQALQRALDSSVQIYDLDLDGNFDLPDATYGLALCLGVLYHLKNPYRLLETLARCARYCVLSTRILGQTPDISRVDAVPVAYFLDERELNDDTTNYWLFSVAALRRIVCRAGWQICTLVPTLADTVNPAARNTSIPDERAYCLLRSQIANEEWRLRLLSGWHPLERASWRWTESNFSALLPVPHASFGHFLALDFYMPAQHLAEIGGVISLTARLNGREMSRTEYCTPGWHIYRHPVPAGSISATSALVEFTTSKAVEPSPSDRRERALVVSFFTPGVSLGEARPPLRLEAR